MVIARSTGFTWVVNVARKIWFEYKMIRGSKNNMYLSEYIFTSHYFIKL